MSGGVDSDMVPGEDANLDEVDATILDLLRAAASALDPVPDGLTERAQFAVAWDEVEAELADIRRTSLGGYAGVRGGAVQPPTSITFSVPGVALVVSVTRRVGNRLRLDGWLTPPDTYEVALRLRGETTTVTATEGRFAFQDIPAGLGQFLVRRAEHDVDLMLTPAVEL